MKLAFVTTLAITREYWQVRSGIADTFGCVLRSHIGTIRSMYADADYYIVVNMRDAHDNTLRSIVSETNVTLRVAHWDKVWLNLKRSGNIECCTKEWEPAFFAPQMMKIEAFSLVKHDYVVYSDLDVFLRAPMKFYAASLPIAGGDANKPLHGGILLFQPSEKLFQKIQSLLYSGFSVSTGWHGCDQECTPSVSNWSWFAAGADEGLMLAALSSVQHFKAASYQKMQSCIPHDHYYGHGKPWERKGLIKRRLWCKQSYKRPSGTPLQCDRVLCTTE